ncbi:MAG: LysM peptidoglycan-binding domain-containing protein, partial [Gemmatimonadetes bacterium]|nr:LysM peptidoglycan-binding domain-containing protein [Gemmatimonadota bacterium]
MPVACCLAMLHALPLNARMHTVRTAETLSHIAARYGISVTDLKRWNGLSSDRISIGQSLTVTPSDSYKVRPGDTLSGIALRHGVKLADLRRLNRLRDDRIDVGQTLRLRPDRTEIRLSNSGTLVVRRGDTLSGIAVAHGTTVSNLRRLNNLRADNIRVGQTLRVTGLNRSLNASPNPSPNPSSGGDSDTFGDPPEKYEVRAGDNLSRIGKRFDVGLAMLRQLNSLTGDRIHPGQKLRLRPAPSEEGTHVVQRGQTLSEIAAEHRIGLAELRRLNGIEGDLIRPGQKLHMRSTPSTVHVVERGDALWEIARAYGMSVADLKSMNGLSGSRIYPGQELRLSPDSSTRLASYTVAHGDNLSEIAQLHQMSVADLQKLNGLRSTVIHPGQKLDVRPLLGHAHHLEVSQIPWDDLFASVD